MMLRSLSIAVAIITALAAKSQTSAVVNSAQSWPIDSLTAERVKELASALSPDNLTGLWEPAGSEGSVVAIVPASGGGMKSVGNYAIVALSSPSPGLPHNAVIGTLRPTAKPGYFDGEMFTGLRVDNSTGRASLTSPKRFTIRRLNANHLVATQVRDGYRIRLWKLIPYMFRSVITEVHNRPDDLDGFVRIFPPDAENSVQVRYF